jgi:hypothetical protein
MRLIVDIYLSFTHFGQSWPIFRRIIFTNMFYTFSRSSALLKEPPIMQPLKNFPSFYGTWRLNTVFTRALHWSLFWATSIQSMPSHPFSLKINFILVHLPTSWSSRWSLSSWLYHQYPICIYLLPHSCYMPHPSQPSRLNHSNSTWRGVQVMKLQHVLYMLVKYLLKMVNFGRNL